MKPCEASLKMRYYLLIFLAFIPLAFNMYHVKPVLRLWRGRRRLRWEDYDWREIWWEWRTSINASLTLDLREKEVSVPASPWTWGRKRYQCQPQHGLEGERGIGASLNLDFREKEVSMPASLWTWGRKRYRCQSHPGLEGERGIGASLNMDLREKEVSVPASTWTWGRKRYRCQPHPGLEGERGISASLNLDLREEEVSVPASTWTSGRKRYRCQPHSVSGLEGERWEQHISRITCSSMIDLFMCACCMLWVPGRQICQYVHFNSCCLHFDVIDLFLFLSDNRKTAHGCLVMPKQLNLMIL